MEVKDWASPAGRQASSGANKLVADALRAAEIDPETNLPRWAIVDEHDIPEDATTAKGIRAKASNRASLIKQGRLRPFYPKGTFEAVSRSEAVSKEDPRQVVRVYARYLGAENEQQAIAAAEIEEASKAKAAQDKADAEAASAPQQPVTV